jgi:hypothetical protein
MKGNPVSQDKDIRATSDAEREAHRRFDPLIEAQVRARVAQEIQEAREAYAREGCQSSGFLLGLRRAEQIADGGDRS